MLKMRIHRMMIKLSSHATFSLKMLTALSFRVHEKTTLQSITLRFRPDLADLIALDRKRSQSYTEDSVREDRRNMVCP